MPAPTVEEAETDPTRDGAVSNADDESAPVTDTTESGEADGSPLADFGGVDADTNGSPNTADDDGDFQVGQVDLNLNDGNDLIAGFDGIEDDESDSSDDEARGAEDKRQQQDHGKTDVSVENAIEEGLCEIAVVGIHGPERDRLRSELRAVASKFKLGYFGEKCVEKYLKTDIDDIPPEYGLAAAMVGFFAIALHKRPDGGERVREVYTVLKDRFSGDDTDESTGPVADTDDEDDNE